MGDLGNLNATGIASGVMVFTISDAEVLGGVASILNRSIVIHQLEVIILNINIRTTVIVYIAYLTQYYVAV